jgi:hypothetical protein
VVDGGGSTDDTAVWGEAASGRGVVGISRGAGGTGVWGVATGGRGVVGVVERAPAGSASGGVDDRITLPSGPGGIGSPSIDLGGPHLGDLTHSTSDVIGGGLTTDIGTVTDVLAPGADDDVGVWGETATGRGVVGKVSQPGGSGVWGTTTNGRAVVGVDDGVGNGVWGESATGRAVVGVAGGPGTGIYGEHRGDGGFAGFFTGDVHVTGSLSAGGDIVLVNADCAEDFDVAGAAAVVPGSVLVVADGGVLRPCNEAYDRRVAGVVSGAGEYRPAVVLDRAARCPDRLPVALVGKVWCRVDARHEPVGPGDLLTSSATAGCAMRATDRERAFGAVLGKALGELRDGIGLVPILVTLQ